jgi:hypothetical protein
MTTTVPSSAQAEEALLREELLSAFAREGIAYPLDRLDEAVAEYVQLKRLMAVVAKAPVDIAPQNGGSQ